MRIAQIAPLFETVPPRRYGGTERVVHWLTEELVAMGHEVTLFASGDSTTSAKLVAAREKAIRFQPSFEFNAAPYARMLELVRRAAGEFDVLHFHLDFHPLSLFSRQDTPFLTTLHGRLDTPWAHELYGMFPDANLVGISDSHRAQMPHPGWAATVLHGMPAHLLTPQPAEQRYLAFLGRISPEKGALEAIEIALATGMKLKIAAKMGEEDRDYQARIRPLLDSGLVEYVGEITDAEKPDFLSAAHAVLFPIKWPEPFGLVMIEAMACGCPVIAFRNGSVPEVIEDGRTGFIVDDVAGAVAACARLPELDRAAVRARFEERWSGRRMARDYLAVYDRLIEAARFRRLRVA